MEVKNIHPHPYLFLVGAGLTAIGALFETLSILFYSDSIYSMPWNAVALLSRDFARNDLLHGQFVYLFAFAFPLIYIGILLLIFALHRSKNGWRWLYVILLPLFALMSLWFWIVATYVSSPHL